MGPTHQSNSGIPDFHSRLGEETITFVVGEAKKHYHVHTHIVKSGVLGDVCAALDQSNRSEDIKSIHWKNVDPSVFANLIEYAYTGDYTVPGLEPLDDELFNEPPSIMESLEDYDWDMDTGGGDEVAFQESRHAIILTAYKGFVERGRELYPTPSERFRNWEPDLEPSNGDGYLAIFQCHVKLYLLARMHGIGHLKRLCLFKLFRTLPHLRDYEHAHDDLAIAILHAYGSTRKGDALRNLLASFAALNTGMMRKARRYADTIRQCPEFAVDMIRQLHSPW
ncbi:hypothetical protein ACRALDRAFT_2024278 [Sodiomyces alcalophilus JCM 7366]|uniref:uncharacterized protein n=1 Tax=Sodiomyces alcalophilus JCM 7366 TaxID=591952 RepID=UPI0039B3BF1E